MRTTSYWLDEAIDAPLLRPLPGRTDVAVIGGGVTGCACALRLATAGVRVRVYDAGAIGGGASGRNGGFALRGASVPYDVAVGRLGREPARDLMTATEHGLEVLAELAGDAFLRVGSLRLAADDDECAALRAEHDALLADGFAVEWVGSLRTPLDRLYRGALLHPTDGAIHPGRWIARLARHAAAAGADLRPHSPVTVVEAAAAADAVVVAVDGWTGLLLPELAASVRPTRGQVLATEPLPELRYRRPHYARGGYDYWQQLPDGRLVLGGQRDASVDTEWTDVDATTPAIQERLTELAAALVGPDAVVSHRWSGMWGTTPDGLPLVGRVRGRDGVWVAGGYSGHGNVLGLVCGRIVADAILGRPLPAFAAPFDPARFG